jgi:hypothetical protein
MMLDLIGLWEKMAKEISKKMAVKNSTEEQPSRRYSSDTSAAARTFDKDTVQSSLEFEKPPNVIFVTEMGTLNPAGSYDDLPEIIMTTEENDARLKVVDEQTTKNPRFYDGKQMVITGVVYDDSSNTIYLEARKVPYSFIVCLSNRKFPDNSALYQLSVFKTGVLAPLITRNGMSILLQRAALGLYSVPGGFLEAHDEAKRLNFYDGRNLVTETAITELKEEIAGNKRFEFFKTQITSISFRRTATNPIGTVEFIAPSHTKCDDNRLRQVFLTNSAKDAHEHTSQYQLIPLDSRKRAALLTILLTGSVKLPGESLYIPVALTLVRVNNQGMGLPRSIPNSFSVAWPLNIFSPKLTRCSILERNKMIILPLIALPVIAEAMACHFSSCISKTSKRCEYSVF